MPVSPVESKKVEDIFSILEILETAISIIQERERIGRMSILRNWASSRVVIFLPFTIVAVGDLLEAKVDDLVD